MNEELIIRALRMLEDRAEFWDREKNYDKADAYESAAEILYYAMTDNIESLAQFDTYREEEG